MAHHNVKKTKVLHLNDEKLTLKPAEVLVGTIFAKNDESQRRWLDLQLAYLKATLESFEHFAILYDNPSDGFLHQTQTLFTPRFAGGNIAHCSGLLELHRIFQKYRSHYKYFLFIDSDAFPFKKDWLRVLLNQMGDRRIAIPIRTENLETRLHSSILFAKDSALDDLKFVVGTNGLDLAGCPETDLTVGEFQNELRGDVFTLVRSNQFNLHPVICGIYYDMFYHHCCGSGRIVNLRSSKYWVDVAAPEVELYTNQLMAQPNELIAKLAGWNPNLYAKVNL